MALKELIINLRKNTSQKKLIGCKGTIGNKKKNSKKIGGI